GNKLSVYRGDHPKAPCLAACFAAVRGPLSDTSDSVKPFFQKSFIKSCQTGLFRPEAYVGFLPGQFKGDPCTLARGYPVPFRVPRLGWFVYLPALA
ncbi:hypothetical protein, partial [Novosphingobium profundi]|uniref:hypothetical protein n=1 Tax=Novosphingobium profundi TaxID=1774954 RepID=UPI001CFD3A24